jgi:ribonuclease Y
MDPVLVGGLAILTFAIGYGVAYARRPLPQADPAVLQRTQDEVERLRSQAQSDVERIRKEAELRARDEAVRLREDVARELEAARGELREQERRVQMRDDAHAEKLRELAKKERHTTNLQRKLHEQRDELNRRQKLLEDEEKQVAERLLEIAGLSREQAETVLFERLERELANELAVRASRLAERTRLQAEEKAREVIAIAVQRYAAIHTSEATVSTVDIPSDEMKGRIIGREGRNIRTFEKATGVDVIVDDTPGVVIVSAFDNVRRETARLSLAKLIADGRIHPTRIEEIVAETQAEMDRRILDYGHQAVADADIGPVPHEKIVQLLGRLRFRTSYSQNVLRHSLEVSHLCGLMAAELGLNAQLARRCGLLHDVGKAADHEMEGGHPKVGAELARRYGETSVEVLHAIAGHHDDVTTDHIYTVLVAAADAISASRPGARRETLEKYIRRMEELEAVACGFPEVEAAFAIQAGRELRVIVNSYKADDAAAQRICRDIARGIEQRLDYPGEIKVTVIRETRLVETAK